MDFDHNDWEDDLSYLFRDGSCSMEPLRDTAACIHAHTCNPPGPDSQHTHTCFHAHLVPSPNEDKIATADTLSDAEKKTKKSQLGNQVASRNYRERRKARAKFLEAEVLTLKAENQKLKAENVTLKAENEEILRLKCLLVHVRSTIDGGIGSFPYQKSANTNLVGAYAMNPCYMQCDDQAYRPQPVVEGQTGESATVNRQGFGGCGLENFQCSANSSSGLKEHPGFGLGNAVPIVNLSCAKKTKGEVHPVLDLGMQCPLSIHPARRREKQPNHESPQS
ncbi:hypothetical protein L1049_015835 [Liquidambar formosana]|uniref:BZIP domain-containing protein n=1 Tax=Liquidambar formosana TaxID=63359 RepID=A0AAP0RZM2_LIQFO